ncbi:MAG: hypothetical protein Q7R30_16520 [Acidobacteriota bacterium]|nr:hypothetical protein [Acidobacteriota bacterium]
MSLALADHKFKTSFNRSFNRSPDLLITRFDQPITTSTDHQMVAYLLIWWAVQGSNL